MGYDKTNLPPWWIETHNNVRTSFAVLIPAAITLTANTSLVFASMMMPDKIDAERVKQLVKPTLYYLLGLVLAFFSSTLFTAIFSWFLLAFYVYLHILLFQNQTMEIKQKEDDYSKWCMIFTLLYWWGMMIAFFFELAHP